MKSNEYEIMKKMADALNDPFEGPVKPMILPKRLKKENQLELYQL